MNFLNFRSSVRFMLILIAFTVAPLLVCFLAERYSEDIDKILQVVAVDSKARQLFRSSGEEHARRWDFAVRFPMKQHRLWTDPGSFRHEDI